MARDPEYNEPAPKKSYTLWYVLGGVGVVLLLSCFGCCGVVYWGGTAVTKELDNKVANEPGKAVTATDLIKAYDQNVASADSQYKGQVVVVTGKVTQADGNIVLDNGVECSPSLTNLTGLASIKVNDIVTLKGVCAGKPLSRISVSSCVKK